MDAVWCPVIVQRILILFVCLMHQAARKHKLSTITNQLFQHFCYDVGKIAKKFASQCLFLKIGSFYLIFPHHFLSEWKCLNIFLSCNENWLLHILPCCDEFRCPKNENYTNRFNGLFHAKNFQLILSMQICNANLSHFSA